MAGAAAAGSPVVVVVGMAARSKVVGRVDMALVSNSSSGAVVRPVLHLDTELPEDGDRRAAGRSKDTSRLAGDRYTDEIIIWKRLIIQF